ncbi:ubiquitin thioesterase otulin-like [Sardina pilchardus]|uniref:ubiquitin thioesterase otulin-like n=1 Tax=Sardina pilchardus TaxID=27697 RepID=UPI002E144A57
MNVQSKGAPFAKLYTGFHFMENPESLGCSLKVRKMPLLMTPIKEALSELHQLVASLNGSAHDSAKDMKLREELCHGERMSILSSFKTDEAGLAEIRDSAADSAPHVVFGLSAASSLGNLVEPKDTSVRSPISKQDKLRLEAKSLPPAQVIKWLVLMERPLSLGPITIPAVKLENRLVQNPSTEVVVNDAPKGQSTSPYSEEGLYNAPDQDQDQYSFGPPVDISVYSESEWKGQTTKSIVIRKGYAVLSQSFGFLRRVKGDNYCALRASLYQALMHTTKPPCWLQQKSILLIPEQLESRYGLIKGWLFPDTCKHTGGIDKSVGLLKCYLRLLQNWWHAAAASPGVEGRRSVCEQLFQGGEDEFGVIEALKLLMLAHSVDLHVAKQRGDNVPIFCWLLFARDTSSSPRSYLANHLSQVGFSRGMEQVDMFLLSCAMRHTIKVYRLHMAETEEFISFYPDDSIQDGHCVCLATEDDRHYDVAFGNPVCAEEDLSGEYD